MMLLIDIKKVPDVALVDEQEVLPVVAQWLAKLDWHVGEQDDDQDVDDWAQYFDKGGDFWQFAVFLPITWVVGWIHKVA